MTTSFKRLFGALLTGLVLVGSSAVSTDAFAGPYYRGHGGYHGGYWRGGYGYGWGGLALGLGIGALVVARPWDPVVVSPTYVYADPPPAPPPPPPPAPVGTPVPSRSAEPIVYPSKGQSPQQTEADRQDCNRWATSQPSAMADASVFHRATMACLEGRGYTVR